MNDSVSPLEHQSMTSTDLVTLGDRIGSIVMKAKDFAHPDAEVGQQQGGIRKLSLREIALALGVSHTAVNKVASTLPSKVESKAGRSYQYTLADALEIRGILEKSLDRKTKEPLVASNRRAEGEPCVTVGVMNFKGGVAKSTTTAHMAEYLALSGYRVLAIDCDPQGTLSTLFGIHPDVELDETDTLVPFFAGDVESLDYCIRSTEIPTLSVIPANVGLAQADMILPARQRDERVKGNDWYYMSALAEGVRSVEANYDVVLIDCPPSMSYLTTVATQACDALLIPMRPSMPDFASSAQFVRMFGTFQADVDEIFETTKLYDWVRVLITLGENNNASVHMEEIIRAAYGGMVMPLKFPYLTAVATAAKSMRTIYDVSRSDIDTRQLSKATQVVDEVCRSIEILIRQTRSRLTSPPTSHAAELA